MPTSNAPEAAIAVEDLLFSYSPLEPPVLKGVSLTVHAGDIVIMTGPSGSGKSTFLSLLAGLEAPQAESLCWGDFDFVGKDSRELDRWRRRNLGIVFQDFQLVPELTALENVLLPQTFSRWTITSSLRRQAGELLERLGVSRGLAQASSLSRGEMQRTSLARALLGRPSVLLADEPTASLDAVNEAAVADLLVDYGRREGATILVATHQPGLKDRADRNLSLDHGLVQEVAQ